MEEGRLLGVSTSWICQRAEVVEGYKLNVIAHRSLGIWWRWRVLGVDPPYENASEGRVFYEKAHLFLARGNIRSGKYVEALAHIAKSKEWPEYLGAGRLYDPDERLQSVMESYCRARLGKGARTSDRSAIEKLQADLKRSDLWKADLLAALLR